MTHLTQVSEQMHYDPLLHSFVIMLVLNCDVLLHTGFFFAVFFLLILIYTIPLFDKIFKRFTTEFDCSLTNLSLSKIRIRAENNFYAISIHLAPDSKYYQDINSCFPFIFVLGNYGFM